MKRDKSLDFIRAFATCLIVTFHFFNFCNQTDSIFYGYANGGWGSVGTTLFFLLSGYALYMKHPVVFNIKNFYKKRWASIYPMFYLAFLLAYFIHAFRGSGFTYGGSFLRLIFTLLGIDSYLGFYSIESYHLVAEWFTTIIILIYLLYPLLVWLFARWRKAVTAILLLVYLLNLQFDLFAVTDDANLITGLYCFWIGMLLCAYHEKLSAYRKPLTVISLVFILLIVFVKLPWQSLLWKNLLGISLFLFLQQSSGLLLRIPGFSFCSEKISKYSYAIYLIHHFIINEFCMQINGYMPGVHTTLFLYAATLYVIFLFAYILYQFHAARRAFHIMNTKKTPG